MKTPFFTIGLLLSWTVFDGNFAPLKSSSNWHWVSLFPSTWLERCGDITYNGIFGWKFLLFFRAKKCKSEQNIFFKFRLRSVLTFPIVFSPHSHSIVLGDVTRHQKIAWQSNSDLTSSVIIVKETWKVENEGKMSKQKHFNHNFIFDYYDSETIRASFWIKSYWIKHKIWLNHFGHRDNNNSKNIEAACSMALATSNSAEKVTPFASHRRLSHSPLLLP